MTTLEENQPHHCNCKVRNSNIVTVCDTQCEPCKAEGVEMKPKKVKADFYHWLMMNMPHWIMYKHVHFDSNKYKVWVPRWGWSKKQLVDAEAKAKELDEKLDWD